MPEPALTIPKDSFEAIQNQIESTIKSGINIRDILANHSNKGPWDTTWEVQAAVEALHVFGSIWTRNCFQPYTLQDLVDSMK